MAVGLVEVNFSLLCLPILYPFTTYPSSKPSIVLPCQTHKKSTPERPESTPECTWRISLGARCAKNNLVIVIWPSMLILLVSHPPDLGPSGQDELTLWCAGCASRRECGRGNRGCSAGPREREKGRVCGWKEVERVLGSHLLVRRLGDILFMAPVCRAPVRRTLDGQDQVPAEKINLTDTQQD